MTVSNVLAGVAVKDLDSSAQWYERIFKRAADTRPMAEVAEWRFPEGGWLQVFRDEKRAGSSSVTFAVKNLDDELQGLRTQGIAIGRRPIRRWSRPHCWLIRTAIRSFWRRQR